MSDDAAVGARPGPHSSGSLSQMLRRLCPEAYECPEPSEPPVPGAHASDLIHRVLDLSRRVVLINLAGGKKWLDEWCGLEYQPVLFRTLDGRWFCARSTIDGYQTPPDCPRGVEFLELNDKQALFWFTEHKIDAPPDLIEAYQCSMGGSNISQADPPAEAPNRPAVSKPDPGSQATSQLKTAASTTEATPPEGESKPPEDLADPVEETITILGRATAQSDLIRFLAARDKRQADLATINKDLRNRKCSYKVDLKITRRLAERARENLEVKNCPLRLSISGNVVRLIDANLSHD